VLLEVTSSLPSSVPCFHPIRRKSLQIQMLLCANMLSYYFNFNKESDLTEWLILLSFLKVISAWKPTVPSQGERVGALSLCAGLSLLVSLPKDFTCKSGLSTEKGIWLYATEVLLCLFSVFVFHIFHISTLSFSSVPAPEFAHDTKWVKPDAAYGFVEYAVQWKPHSEAVTQINENSCFWPFLWQSVRRV
jgi:hypothetical protein